MDGEATPDTLERFGILVDDVNQSKEWLTLVVLQ
jgi:hypothetical protein